jgi:2-polyprenyl-3-methyl-5-hydroxy-6-metoxy-1,4-benzoquinol methylase
MIFWNQYFDDLLIKVNDMKKYRKSQIISILKKTKFEYHRVDLPYNLHTTGQDRSATANLIFPSPLNGTTVLDVGCAIGYFCFEAESRGAEFVLGLEKRESRFEQAIKLKEIRDSQVNFIKINVEEYQCEKSFDYVLLLNVLHHLQDPLAILQKLSSIVNKQLIIEFPTFEDKRFQRFLPSDLHNKLNQLPLIGVSSLKNKKFDQTFIFSPIALERILLDHNSSFSSVKFIESPMKGRAIAFCDK